MNKVKLRKLKDHPATLADAGEPLVIKRHGEAIGVFIPFKKADKAAAARAADKLAATLEAIYTKTGMSEDEFIAAFLAADDDAPAN
jgi:antitoxin (DNA-binding transcriptional repressor) of toxin-antitoxin stability system